MRKHGGGKKSGFLLLRGVGFVREAHRAHILVLYVSASPLALPHSTHTTTQLHNSFTCAVNLRVAATAFFLRRWKTKISSP